MRKIRRLPFFEVQKGVEASAKIIRARNFRATLLMAGRRNRADSAAIGIHAAERFQVRQPQFQSRGLARRQIQRVVRGHFRAGVLRIHRGLVVADQIVVETVFYVAETGCGR